MDSLLPMDKVWSLDFLGTYNAFVFTNWDDPSLNCCLKRQGPSLQAWFLAGRRFEKFRDGGYLTDVHVGVPLGSMVRINGYRING